MHFWLVARECIRPLGSMMRGHIGRICNSSGCLFPPNIRQKVIRKVCKEDTSATGCAFACASLFNWSRAAPWRGPTPCYEIVAGTPICLVARRYVRPSGSTVSPLIRSRFRRFGYLCTPNLRQKVIRRSIDKALRLLKIVLYQLVLGRQLLRANALLRYCGKSTHSAGRKRIYLTFGLDDVRSYWLELLFFRLSSFLTSGRK